MPRRSSSRSRRARGSTRDGAEARFGGQLASKASRALFELGRWDESEELIAETLSGTPTRYAVRWLLSNRIRLHAGRGDLDGARADLETYASLGERVVGPDPDLIGARRAELAIQTGDAAIAREIVRATLGEIVEPELDTDARALLLIGLRAEAVEAEAARAAGDGRREREAIARGAELERLVAGHFARIDRLVAQPAAILAADRALAAAMAAQVRGAADPDLWDAAAAGRRSLGRPFELASVLEWTAVSRLVARRRDDGMAALIEAHAIATDLGARPAALAPRVDRASGSSRARGGRHRRRCGRSARPHAARAGGARPPHRWAKQPRDRRRAVHGREHGRRPRQQHPRQARGAPPARGGRPRPADGPRRELTTQATTSDAPA